MKLFVLLPAYNEAESVPRLLPKLQAEIMRLGIDYSIILCDDGSTDATVEALSSYLPSGKVVLLRHKINRGLGETMRDLYEYAAEHAADTDIIVRMDCDDTHEPKYIGPMLEKLAEGMDVVIASRFARGGGQSGVTTYRAILSRGANLFMKMIFPIAGVQEYSCGYRAYRAAIIKQAIQFYGNDFIQLKGLGFTGTLEKLIKLKLLRARIGEIGFHLRYDQKLSSSKMITSITTLGYLTLAVCYYWPWGGWRTNWGRKFTQAALGYRP